VQSASARRNNEKKATIEDEVFVRFPHSGYEVRKPVAAS
jgi:hypothetical protein